MKKLIASILFLFAIITATNAQLYIDNLQLLPELKKGKTYVGVGKPAAEENPYVTINSSGVDSSYIKVIKKYWTATTLEFVPFEDLKKHYLEPNASFISVNAVKYEKIGNFSPRYNFNTNQGSYCIFSLDFWSCKGRAKKRLNNGRRMYLSDVNRIACYYINTGGLPGYYVGSNVGEFEPVNLITGNRVSHGDFPKAFGAGLLKNMVQEMNRSVLGKKKFKYGRREFEAKELSALKTDTLYIPQSVAGGFIGNEKKAFLEYPYAYAVVSDNMLNALILNRAKPFYYLLFYGDIYTNLLSIVNSSTGKTVYYEKNTKTLGSYDDGDVKAIAKAIKKS